MKILQDLLEFGKLKGIGVIVLLIGLVGFLCFGYYKTITNHFHDTQSVLRENAQAITGITAVMIENIEVARQTNEIIQDFRQELRAK